MNAISIGPFMLAADRASAIVGILAFTVVAGVLARRADGSLSRWSSWALPCGLVAARLGHVGLNWEGFSEEPARILAVWQGGFFWPAGVAGAAVLLLPLVRATTGRLAGLASLAAGLFIWHLGVSLHSSVEPIALSGQPLQTFAGESRQLSELEGQPMVINLWATWCPPCRREMPMMTEVARNTEGTTFVFANQGEDAPRIRAYLAAESLDPPNVLLDDLGALGRHLSRAGSSGDALHWARRCPEAFSSGRNLARRVPPEDARTRRVKGRRHVADHLAQPTSR